MRTDPDHYLIVDFEATCCDHASVPGGEMEIIEVGAVRVNARTLESVDEFQSFVRPVRHPVLTPFCKQLTSIRQVDVDDAPIFPELVTQWAEWLGNTPGTWVLGAWGDYDLKQLRQDCEFHQITHPLHSAKLHLNLKRLMSEKQLLGKQPTLNEALQLAGLEFKGTPHRGIDDARNIMRLLPYIVGEQRLPSRPQVDRRRR